MPQPGREEGELGGVASMSYLAAHATLIRRFILATKWGVHLFRRVKACEMAMESIFGGRVWVLGGQIMYCVLNYPGVYYLCCISVTGIWTVVEGVSVCSRWRCYTVSVKWWVGW